MKKIVIYIIAVILLASMGVFGWKGYESCKSYEKISLAIVEKNNVTELSKIQIKRLADMLSLGIYSGYEKVLEEQKKLLEQQTSFKERTTVFTLYFTGAVSLLLLLYLIMTLQEFTIVLSLSGLIALTVGLFSPVMMMSVHKEVQYLGDVVLIMESKGVLGSIAKLFENNDYVVGGALLLFSVIFPLLKTLSMLFIALFIRNNSAQAIVSFFKILGKWSMTDVFVVATFLVYLSAGKGGMSRTEVQAGLYFFLAYVILSMLASLTADKMLRQSNTVKTE